MMDSDHLEAYRLAGLDFFVTNDGDLLRAASARGIAAITPEQLLAQLDEEGEWRHHASATRAADRGRRVPAARCVRPRRQRASSTAATGPYGPYVPVRCAY